MSVTELSISRGDTILRLDIGTPFQLAFSFMYTSFQSFQRVIQPPADQRNIPRLGVFYFAMANDDVKPSPLVESPVLQRKGIKKYFEDGMVPTMAGWRKQRTARYGKSQLKVSAEEEGVEEEIIHGTVVKHYN